jgi:hypothetical protein
MKPHALALLLVAVAGSACAPIPKPRVLDEVDEIGKSPAAGEAKSHAVPTWARAEKLRLEAHEAAERGPLAHAQFLAEEAIATYHEGANLARLAKATVREQGALSEAEKLAAELMHTEAELERSTADVEALEQRLRAARALKTSAAPDTPEKAKERALVARETLLEGRLLCSAARLLGAGNAPPAAAPAKDDAVPTSPAALARDLLRAEAALAATEAAISPGKSKGGDDPLGQAISARAECLSLLSRTRRAETAKHTRGSEARSADALLSAISAMGGAVKQRALAFAPGRDERGVVVTLRSVFEGEAIAAGAKSRLEDLDRVAGQHPAFPIAVVVRSDKPIAPSERARWEARAESVASVFKSVDKARRVVFVSGDKPSPERAGDARVEIVFIAPEAM